MSDQELFSNPAEFSSKDILKRAEFYQRERQRSRGRGSPGQSYQQGYGQPARYAQPNYHQQQSGQHPAAYRGEVKHTHPHFHAGAFSPPATSQNNGRPFFHNQGQPPVANGQSLPFFSPTQERPLSWQSPHPGQQHQQNQSYQQQQQQQQYQGMTSPATGSFPRQGNNQATVPSVQHRQ